MAKFVYEALEEANEDGEKEDVVEALQNLGRIAANHTRGKIY